MSLADDVLSALPDFQAAAESLMLDECILERRTGETVTDPITGVVTDEWAQVYSGKFKLTGRVAQATTPEAGGHAYLVEQLMVHFPVSTSSAAGDRVTILATTLDPLLVGLQVRLTELARGGIRTAYRWNVELMTA